MHATACFFMLVLTRIGAPSVSEGVRDFINPVSIPGVSLAAGASAMVVGDDNSNSRGQVTTDR